MNMFTVIGVVVVAFVVPGYVGLRKGQGAEDRGQGNGLFLVGRDLERPKVDNLLAGRVREALIGQGERSENDQDDTKKSRRFHSAILPFTSRTWFACSQSSSRSRPWAPSFRSITAMSSTSPGTIPILSPLSPTRRTAVSGTTFS